MLVKRGFRSPGLLECLGTVPCGCSAGAQMEHSFNGLPPVLMMVTLCA